MATKWRRRPDRLSSQFDGRSGGVFAPVGRERFPDGLEGLADLAGDVGAGCDPFSTLHNGGLSQAVKIADQVVSFDDGTGRAAAVGGFLLEHEGEK